MQPDLIIGNKEENYQEGIEQLAARYPVWLSDITNLDDALRMIRQVGVVVGAKTKADQLAADIEDSFARLAASSATSAGSLLHLAQTVHGGGYGHFYR